MVRKTEKSARESGSVPSLAARSPVSAEKPTPADTVPPVGTEKNKDVDTPEEIWYKELDTESFLKLKEGAK